MSQKLIGVPLKRSGMYASERVDESDLTKMPRHSRATIYGIDNGVVRLMRTDFTGNGNESFTGRDSMGVVEFCETFPVYRGQAN